MSDQEAGWLSEVFHTARHWRAIERIVSVASAVRQNYATRPRHMDKVSRRYWRQIIKRAWIRGRAEAWGNALAANEKTIVPTLLATLAGIVTGSIAGNALVGVAAGLATAIAWTAFFFAVNLVALPARIHAGLVDKLSSAREEIDAYHSVVDRRMVRNLLLRMREKCLAYRNNHVTVAEQVHWANQLLGDLSTLYGPEAEAVLRRELPYLTDPSASPQTMDFYMRHLADRLLTQTDKVGLDIYSMHKPDLNRFVRRRLSALQDETLPANAPAVKPVGQTADSRLEQVAPRSSAVAAAILAPPLARLS